MHQVDKVIREYHERTFHSFHKFTYRINGKQRSRALEEGNDSGWRIVKILDHTPKSRVAKKTFVLYLVKWKGYDNLWTWKRKSTTQHYEGAKLLSCYQVANSLRRNQNSERQLPKHLKEEDETYLKNIGRTSTKGQCGDETLEPMWALLELKMMGNKELRHNPCTPNSSL